MIYYDKLGSYERIAQKLLKGKPKPKPIARFIEGKLLTGTQSLHRTYQSRTWRLFWRLKDRRRVVYYHDFGTFALKAPSPAALEKARQHLFEVMQKYNNKAIEESAKALPDIAVEIGKGKK